MNEQNNFYGKTKKKKKMGDHDISQCSHKLDNKFIHEKIKRATEGKDIVTLVQNQHIRDLLVPKRKPIELPGIWPKSEFKRLQQQAHVITKEDKLAMIEEAERKKNAAVEASEQRKKDLAKAQVVRPVVLGSKLDTVESDAKAKNEYLLQRSHELMNEQDDRVKAANGLILATKCRAIRNAQIIEKELIHKQLQEEERRLDDMMEQSRQKKIHDEEQKHLLEEQKKQRYITEIKQQIRDNDIEKLLEAERIEEESKLINKALIALQEEEAAKLAEKKVIQQKMREDILQSNKDLERYKLIQQEEQRIADLRVQEFMRRKAEREAAHEEELAKAKAAKEKEIARLRQQQEKAADRQAMLDEMNARRIQEEVEKAWREKERAAALKRKEEIDHLKASRAQQIEDIMRAQAIQLSRDESDFYKIVKVQQELFNKENEKERKKREANLCHRRDLLKQINEKERERIMEQKEKFEDGNASRLQAEIRDKEIHDYLIQKMQKLRQNNVPDELVKDIERQLKIKK